jgi:hypothetical protein
MSTANREQREHLRADDTGRDSDPVHVLVGSQGPKPQTAYHATARCPSFQSGRQSSNSDIVQRAAAAAHDCYPCRGCVLGEYDNGATTFQCPYCGPIEGPFPSHIASCEQKPDNSLPPTPTS